MNRRNRVVLHSLATFVCGAMVGSGVGWLIGLACGGMVVLGWYVDEVAA